MRYPLHDTVRTRTLRTRTLTELVDRLLFRAAQGNAGVPRGGGPLRDPTAAGPVSPGGRVTAFFTRLQYRRSAARWRSTTAGSGAPSRTCGYRSRLERSLLARVMGFYVHCSTGGPPPGRAVTFALVPSPMEGVRTVKVPNFP